MALFQVCNCRGPEGKGGHDFSRSRVGKGDVAWGFLVAGAEDGDTPDDGFEKEMQTKGVAQQGSPSGRGLSLRERMAGPSQRPSSRKSVRSCRVGQLNDGTGGKNGARKGGGGRAHPRAKSHRFRCAHPQKLKPFSEVKGGGSTSAGQAERPGWATCSGCV